MSGDVGAASLLDLASAAEHLGYDSVWVGDSIVARPRHEPLAMLAALAGRTESVTLGTAVLLPVLRHPVVMAHQVATVDRLAEGRVVLGVGIATDTPTTHHEFASVGVPFDRRVGRFNDHLDICRRLWSGETVDHHSDFYDLDGVAVHPTPHRLGGPPIWVAGANAVTQRRVGNRYDGWMPIGPSDGFSAGLEQVRNAAQRAGRDPNALTASAYVTIALDDDVERADRTMNDFMAAYYPAPPEAMRALQANYAGPASGLAGWIREFTDGGASHIIFRFAGDHQRHLGECSDALSNL
jgi:probable F420-dependent oxidoreductase